MLRVNGDAAIAIEAKKLGTSLGAKEAGQVVAYCSNLGVRWGAVSDGREFKLYDAPMLGVPPAERQVLSVDLSDYKDREDFEARIYPELELIAKTELQSGAGLERRVALEAARELLTSSTSEDSPESAPGALMRPGVSRILQQVICQSSYRNSSVSERSPIRGVRGRRVGRPELALPLNLGYAGLQTLACFAARGSQAVSDHSRARCARASQNRHR